MKVAHKMEYHNGMKKWQVLELAKGYLAKDWEETCDYENKRKYICHAIGEVVGDRYYGYDSSGLVGVIESRLAPYCTYQDWLYKKKNISIPCTEEGITQLQRSRHNWIDAMIKEFKEKDE